MHERRVSTRTLSGASGSVGTRARRGDTAPSDARAGTPALAAIQEAAKSTIPTLGYGVSYAVGNVLLALWGTIIVALL